MKFYEKQSGQWSGRVQVTSAPKGNKKAVPVTVLFKADSLKRLRMDITTISGFYVGSVLVEGDNFKALMAREKKFYKGKISARTMKRILSLPLDPRWLLQILFEVPGEGWSCEYSKKDYLQECTDSSTGFKVTWEDRVLDQRSLVLKMKETAANLFLHDFSSTIDGASEAFTLSAPRGFKVVRVK